MSRRTRLRRNDGDAISAGLLLFVFWVFTYFQSDPLLISISCGLFVSAFAFFALWLRQRMTVRRLNRIIASQLYLDYSPRQFEKVVADLFRAQGYEAKVTPGSGDGGIDILLNKVGKTYGVECKQYKDANVLGPKYIRDFIGALQLKRLKAGFFVTTSSFSQQARIAAKESEYQIYLIDGEALGRWQRTVKQSMDTGKPHTIAFLPFRWWVAMSRPQQAVVLILLFLALFTAAFMALYVGGSEIVQSGWISCSSYYLGL